MKPRPTDTHGDPMINAKELALLLGVTEAEIKAHANAAGTGVNTLPQEWIDRGLERSRIYRQATGKSDMAGSLQFWAGQQ